MAGVTNNIAVGESVTNICENVNKLLKTAQDTYPLSKIMFSSIHHRTELDDCITINKKTDAVNNNVKHLCSLRGYMFMDDNTSSSVFSPDSARLKDGLHLTTTGIQQLSQRIKNSVNSRRDKAAKLASSHIQQPDDHNEKRLMNSKPQIRNSDIKYKPTHPRQQSVPLCISAPPPPSSDQDYDARQVHTCATTPHKEGKHAPALID